MSEGDTTPESSQIEMTKEFSDIGQHSRIYINVKGKTLEECRKHFDEIRKEDGGIKSE